MAASQDNPLEELYRRPGFMIRRMHQIAVSLFVEETGKLGVTNRQYGILFVLEHRPGIDQISVANLLGLDGRDGAQEVGTGWSCRPLRRGPRPAAAQLAADEVRKEVALPTRRAGAEG